MKLLYFGTVCDPVTLDLHLKRCKSKPSVASLVFESALLEGFQRNGVDMEIHSYPMIPSFLKSKHLTFGGFTEKLQSGYDCHWLNTVNIPVLKQFSRHMNAKKILKRWARKNANNGVVLTYSIPPFMVKDIIRLRRRYKFTTVAIVPDLPSNMYLNHKENILIQTIKNVYLNRAIFYQGAFDGYVYLTEAMADAVAPGKPYMVMEGILNEVCVTEYPKSCPRAIMYAGRLHEKYGVMALVNAFERVNLPNTELWLFGDGTAVEEIQKRAEVNQNIRYFGRVSREEILKREKEATLLVNPRSPKDSYTQYSFPSKTIEYMYSGTPLLTTKLSGIPAEYLDYVFVSEDNTEPALDRALIRVLSMTDEQLSLFSDEDKLD